MQQENAPAHVAQLQTMREAGDSCADMLHWLAGEDLDSVAMMSAFREAFDLGFDEVSCIGGWFSDGSGELSDGQINDLLEPAVYAPDAE